MINDQAVFAIFRNDAEIQQALRGLEEAGLETERVSVLRPDSARPLRSEYDHHTDVVEGALVGAILGTISGIFVGLFLRDTSFIVHLGANPVLITLIFGLAGLVLGAASGALVGIGTPEQLSKRYAKSLQEGHVLISFPVVTEDEAKRALAVFERYGGAEPALEEKTRILDEVFQYWHPGHFRRA